MRRARLVNSGIEKTLLLVTFDITYRDCLWIKTADIDVLAGVAQVCIRASSRLHFGRLVEIMLTSNCTSNFYSGAH